MQHHMEVLLLKDVRKAISTHKVTMSINQIEAILINGFRVNLIKDSLLVNVVNKGTKATVAKCYISSSYTYFYYK